MVFFAVVALLCGWLWVLPLAPEIGISEADIAWCTWYAADMGTSRTAQRRWFGAVALAAALAMLILGQTLLQPSFGPVAFLLYWLACLALTLTAILVALADLRAMKHKIRAQERDLLEQTLKEIQAEAAVRRAKGRKGESG